LSSHDIPEGIQRFVSVNIHSVEQLEILLTLREDAAKEWDAEDVSRRVYTRPASAAQRLTDLEDKGLLTAREEGGRRLYRYAPREASLDEAVQALADYYKQYRVSVIDLIYSQPRGPIRLFSDAFKFRRKEEK